MIKNLKTYGHYSQLISFNFVHRIENRLTGLNTHLINHHNSFIIMHIYTWFVNQFLIIDFSIYPHYN